MLEGCTSILPPPFDRLGRFKAVTTYHVNSAHVRWKEEILTPLFPNSTYVTVLRWPYTEWLSTYEYFDDKRPPSRFHWTPEKYLIAIDSFYEEMSAMERLHFVNSMCFDLGVEAEDSIRVHEIPSIGQDLIDRMHRAMPAGAIILEKLDESLVMMKRDMGWALTDVTYLSSKIPYDLLSNGTNLIPPVVSRYNTANFSDEARSQFEKWIGCDLAIYRHFDEMLEGKIVEADKADEAARGDVVSDHSGDGGITFRQEVALLRHLNELLREMCDDFIDVKLPKKYSHLCKVQDWKDPSTSNGRKERSAEEDHEIDDSLMIPIEEYFWRLETSGMDRQTRGGGDDDLPLEFRDPIYWLTKPFSDVLVRDYCCLFAAGEHAEPPTRFMWKRFPQVGGYT
eukprot:TRINITY_DN1302_c0_g1_i2.p1 TRINITY_DN1302_c0_g1~~TRINITY_DN1302_c0_g1_i2.p1  ORF type:complete len:395 (-),score=101.57 TRINITY_DN1302_c0_g1_i2:49-1233(-)